MMDYGAEINAEDVNCDTPLEYAVKKDSLELVMELIRTGAVVDQHVIRQAIINPRAVEMMPILVQGDFSEATTPISEKIAKLTLYLSLLYIQIDESKILPSVEIIEDEVVFFSSVVRGKVKMAIAELLVRRGNVDVNITDSEGNNPFSVVVSTSAELSDIYNCEMIKHCAMLTSKGLRVNEGDMQIVRSIDEFSIFYDQYSSELENMKLTVFNYISIYTMLIEDVKKLSWLTRNCSLVENYKKVQLKESLPLYHSEVEWKFRNSKKRTKLLLSQENVACEVLNEFLLNLVVAKIIFYLYMDNV